MDLQFELTRVFCASHKSTDWSDVEDTNVREGLLEIHRLQGRSVHYNWHQAQYMLSFMPRLCKAKTWRTSVLWYLQKFDMDVDVGDGSVDFRGQPSKKSTSGGWKAAYFIMGI